MYNSSSAQSSDIISQVILDRLSENTWVALLTEYLKAHAHNTRPYGFLRSAQCYILSKTAYKYILRYQQPPEYNYATLYTIYQTISFYVQQVDVLVITAFI